MKKEDSLSNYELVYGAISSGDDFVDIRGYLYDRRRIIENLESRSGEKFFGNVDVFRDWFLSLEDESSSEKESICIIFEIRKIERKAIKNILKKEGGENSESG